MQDTISTVIRVLTNRNMSSEAVLNVEVKWSVRLVTVVLVIHLVTEVMSALKSTIAIYLWSYL